MVLCKFLTGLVGACSTDACAGLRRGRTEVVVMQYALPDLGLRGLDCCGSEMEGWSGGKEWSGTCSSGSRSSNESSAGKSAGNR